MEGRGKNMSKRKQIPARTIEGRINQVINLAVEEAEKRLLNGTASSQIITTLLKWASLETELKLEQLRTDIALSQAKQKEIEAKASSNDLYTQALAAFKSYKGVSDDEDDYED